MKMNLLGIQSLQTFENWLTLLDEVCFQYMGVGYRDLPDQNLKALYQDGMTPKVACFQMMQNLDAADVYFQEFDCFTDADPGL
jgi:hypothetical protein